MKSIRALAQTGKVTNHQGQDITLNNLSSKKVMKSIVINTKPIKTMALLYILFISLEPRLYLLKCVNNYYRKSKKC